MREAAKSLLPAVRWVTPGVRTAVPRRLARPKIHRFSGRQTGTADSNVGRCRAAPGDIQPRSRSSSAYRALDTRSDSRCAVLQHEFQGFEEWTLSESVSSCCPASPPRRRRRCRRLPRGGLAERPHYPGEPRDRARSAPVGEALSVRPTACPLRLGCRAGLPLSCRVARDNPRRKVIRLAQVNAAKMATTPAIAKIIGSGAPLLRSPLRLGRASAIATG